MMMMKQKLVLALLVQAPQIRTVGRLMHTYLRSKRYRMITN